jgi:hypothetical protein
MADLVGLDWPRYFRTLPENDVRALATWLGAQGLRVGEFMEVVDRVYATAPRRSRGHTDIFVSVVGRPTARSYAQRKRHFGRLMAMLEAAIVSGALPGDVAPQELDRPVVIQTEPRPVDELLAALEQRRAAVRRLR